jgi:CheY-like chemotaxis protein
MKVLVADDEEVVLEVLRRLLEHLGHEVIAVRNGLEGIHEFNNNKGVELVLTDLLMPVVNGVTLACHCKSQRPDVPVIILSGYEGEMMKLKELKHAVDLYLQKPIHLSALKEAIDSCSKV